MDLATAKTQFLAFSKSFTCEKDRVAFLDWLGKEVVVPHLEGSSLLSSIPESGPGSQTFSRTQAGEMLEKIAASLRPQLPVEAVLPSETIRHPTSGEDAGLSPQNCVHVDSFLYDEKLEEELVQEGKLDRSYCLDCNSRRIEDLTYITHSCSKERLEFIFGELLPSLQGKKVLDIGSRLGAVLYGAYYYSQAEKIVGVEINKDFCKLQEETISTFGLSDRVSVVLGNMCAQGQLLAEADVVILNNVFSWFMPEKLQVKMWQCLQASVSPGALLVTIPSLEASLGELQTGIQLSDWVREQEGCFIPVGQGDSQVSHGVLAVIIWCNFRWKYRRSNYTKSCLGARTGIFADYIIYLA